MRLAVVFMLSCLLAPVAAADEFSMVEERDGFVALVEGRELTRFGIRLSVTPDGAIRGRAFGRDVRGAWKWRSGYFCRSLHWGSRDLGPNCQAVKVQGGTIRFISDRGAGDFANFRLK